MNKDFLRGIKFGSGILVVFLVAFSVYAVGFHQTSEIVPGVFQGDYAVNGSLDVENGSFDVKNGENYNRISISSSNKSSNGGYLNWINFYGQPISSNIVLGHDNDSKNLKIGYGGLILGGNLNLSGNKIVESNPNLDVKSSGNRYNLGSSFSTYMSKQISAKAGEVIFATGYVIGEADCGNGHENIRSRILINGEEVARESEGATSEGSSCTATHDMTGMYKVSSDGNINVELQSSESPRTNDNVYINYQDLQVIKLK